MNLEEEQEVVTLSEVCRVCLVRTDNMKHLLGSNEEVIQIISKLSSVSNIEIKINDTLPCFLCNTCEEKLKVSYDFQQLCQKSHNFILACLSASSVTFKVNSFKPLHFEDNSEESATQILDNNTDALISFVDNAGLEKKVLISYCPLPKVPVLTDSDNVLKENEVENIVDETVRNEVLNDTSDIKNKSANVLINESDIPPEVEKRTKYNQTMRLSQFPPQYVDSIIRKTREKILKHVNCLLCNFTATNSRSLSVHMTRLHKEMKENWCVWCNNMYDNLQEHTKTDHKDDLKCTLCGKYKTSIGHLVTHLSSHSIERSHVCRQCGKSFISRRHLKVHFRVHSRPNVYLCRVCSRSFLTPNAVNNHLRTHYKRKCKVCEDHFPCLDEYKSHKCFSERKDVPDTKQCNPQPKVKGPPQNFCKICNKRVRSLPIHLQKIHSGTPKEKTAELKALCSFCGKGFKRAGKLAEHMRVHTGETPYQCSYCDRRMKTRIHLVVHERIHTGERPHICKFCGKSFAQTSVLNTHMKIHTGKPEKCPSCDKRFCRPSELKLHMRIHTGERPYECNICGERFAHQGHLSEHTKRHIDERPYKCDYCEKSFTQSASLRSHTYIHLGKKPFQCSECHYSCRQKYSLKMHMLLRHDKKSNPDQQLHKCEICEQYFMSYQSFSIHFNDEHGSLDEHDKKCNSDQQLHRCEICDQYFLSYQSFTSHFNDEHGSLEGQSIVKDDLIETPPAEVIDHLKEFT